METIASPSRRRSLQRVRHHYEVEKALAAQLRSAPRELRLGMLTGLYEQLFREVPDHPRVARKHSPEDSRRHVMAQLRFLRRFLRPQFSVLEIGPGDCAFAFELAKHVRQVYAVDVDAVLSRNVRTPENFSLFLSDGVSMPVPMQSVHVAYSNQLMEHLHPDDAREQLRNIFGALAPGGLYVCITPNRLDGPHDISRHFSDEPEGFHLKEYTVTELEALFRRAGFRRVAAYSAMKGVWSRVPLAALRALESVLERMPVRTRRRIGARWPLRQLLNCAVVATR
jgi:SAM-dependent methyltransferase